MAPTDEVDLDHRLKNESRRATRLLKGKVVQSVRRSKVGELMLQFTDGARLYIDVTGTEMELSIT